MVATRIEVRKSSEFPPARFVDHPSFQGKNAEDQYRVAVEIAKAATKPVNHLPDEVTRVLAMSMHYAAYRWNRARHATEAERWRSRYIDLRNQIVVGNRKLIFRAVQSRVRDFQAAEDCAAECHLVLIRAVAAYNPWLGIRFSTYAFTCLLRELTRLVRKQTTDRLRQAVSFHDPSAEDGLEGIAGESPLLDANPNLSRFFTADHTLLDDREKRVLSQRFGFNSDGKTVTLKNLGSELNISRERVRQLQNSGLEKLRHVFGAGDISI